MLRLIANMVDLSRDSIWHVIMALFAAHALLSKEKRQDGSFALKKAALPFV